MRATIQQVFRPFTQHLNTYNRKEEWAYLFGHLWEPSQYIIWERPTLVVFSPSFFALAIWIRKITYYTMVSNNTNYLLCSLLQYFQDDSSLLSTLQSIQSYIWCHHWVSVYNQSDTCNQGIQSSHPIRLLYTNKHCEFLMFLSTGFTTLPFVVWWSSLLQIDFHGHFKISLGPSISFTSSKCIFTPTSHN